MALCVQAVSRKQVLKLEFSVFSALGFGMHVRIREVMPHFTRLLKVRRRARDVVACIIPQRECEVRLRVATTAAAGDPNRLET